MLRAQITTLTLYNRLADDDDDLFEYLSLPSRPFTDRGYEDLFLTGWDIDKTTDVLSFPNIDWEAPADYENVDEEEFNCSSFNPETGLPILGEICLNKDRIISQAGEYGHSVKREFAFLIAHSMLHLLGYDHMEDDEAKVMEEKQKEYLEDLKISR